MFQGVLYGPPNHEAIASHVFVADDRLSFTFIPQSKYDAAMASFVKLHGDEKLVCYCDTTVFGGGKDGFALTDSRMLWHEMWGTACSVRYAEIGNYEIVPDGGENSVLNFVTANRDKSQTYKGLPPKIARGVFNFLSLVLAASAISGTAEKTVN